MQWSVAVEGPTDLAVVEAILRHCGHGIGCSYPANGKSRLDPRIPDYAKASARSPWLILRDMDHDAACAPELLRRLLPLAPSDCLRIPVRSAEAWLLADSDRAAAWLGVGRSKVPHAVEQIEDPKRELINLARRSRKREITIDLVPTGTARVGKGYVEQVRRFCSSGWRPGIAAEHSDSLRRCMDFIARSTRR